MFTGLVQQTGNIASISARTDRGTATRITVNAGMLAQQLKTGDSISVSGVCLTALEIRDRHFSADLAEETLQRTSLGALKPGAVVNLELPARAEDPLGGHIVQGHVDGVGKLVALQKVSGHDDWRLVVEVPSAVAQYVVSQGSICIEGISLTVARVEGTQVEVAIIPHTYQVTNLHGLRPGDPLNIEADVLAKYAEKLAAKKAATKPLRVEDLLRQGF